MQLAVKNRTMPSPFLFKERWFSTLKSKIGKVITLLLFSIFLGNFNGFSQETLSEVLKKYNSESVPYITAQELAMPKTKAIILDAREIDEYKVSHIKNAIYVGYDNFDIEKTIKNLNNKQQEIVVYCSLGIRSEDVAEQLKEADYSNVKNLYGGIFEWKNNNFSVFDSEEKETQNVHTFSKEWSKWLKNGIKIYTN